MMLKGSIHKENIALNNKSFKIHKNKLLELKGEIVKSTITVRDFNTPLLASDRRVK